MKLDKVAIPVVDITKLTFTIICCWIIHFN